MYGRFHRGYMIAIIRRYNRYNYMVVIIERDKGICMIFIIRGYIAQLSCRVIWWLLHKECCGNNTGDMVATIRHVYFRHHIGNVKVIRQGMC